nr:cytochrome c oxidase assembly protein [Streptomyces sp. A1136]
MAALPDASIRRHPSPASARRGRPRARLGRGAAVHLHRLPARPREPQVEPGWRGGALLAAGWAHTVLAKTLYVLPPPGTAFTSADLQGGAQLTYYGGDIAEIALATVLAAQWYTATDRARRRARRRSTTVRRPQTEDASA